MSFQTHCKQHNLFSILYSFVLTHAVNMLHSAIEEKVIAFLCINIYYRSLSITNIYGKYFVMQHLLICHAPLPLEASCFLERQGKNAGFSHVTSLSPLAFQREQRHSVAPHTIPTDNQCPGRVRIYTQPFCHVHERTMPVLI